MPTGRWQLALLVSVPALADVASTLAAPSSFWSQFLPTLYYAGIVIAGLTFGWKAGLSLAFLAGVCHSLIAYLLLASPVVRLEAQLLAFLVVGFAFIEERRHATKLLTRSQISVSESTRTVVDSQMCVDQVSAIAGELLREVRTPLASIEGAAFILEEGGLGPTRAVEFVDIIRRECQRVNRALAEIGECTEALALNCEPANVALMLGEAVRMSAMGIPDAAISLRTEVASDLHQVWCDKKEIQKLISASIISAMNSMPGGGEILVAADRKNGHVRIQLKVLGQTIRASDPAAGRGPYSSTFDMASGLRLLAARRTVLQHGGTIDVDQTGWPNRLVCFTIPLYNEQRRP